MADKIRVNYPALEDMAKHLQMCADRLAQSAATAQKIGAQMQGGALVGQAGDIYVQALGIFYQRVMKLSEKYMDVANEIRQAMSDMQQADGTAGSNF